MKSAPQVRTNDKTDNATAVDTRARILAAALRLFRKRGYHAAGLNDILEMAQAPKGSLYHHFPKGKEEIAVAVVAHITQGIIDLFSANRARTTAAMLVQVGDQMAEGIERTNHELCALFSSFVAERSTSPLLGAAVASAYDDMTSALQQRFTSDGLTPRAARERAAIVVMLLEGGAILAQAQQSVAPFRLAVKQASILALPPVMSTRKT
jgi:TetR/AcrR family transcriptional regulator, lmrAB and yxaGH operons repressor